MWLLFLLLELAPLDQVLDVEIQFSSGLLFGLLDVSKVLISGLPVWGAFSRSCPRRPGIPCLHSSHHHPQAGLSRFPISQMPPGHQRIGCVSPCLLWECERWWSTGWASWWRMSSLLACLLLANSCGEASPVAVMVYLPQPWLLPRFFIKWHFGRVWLSWNEKCSWGADYWLKWLVTWYTLGRDCTVPSCKTAKGWDQLAHR